MLGSRRLGRVLGAKWDCVRPEAAQILTLSRVLTPLWCRSKMDEVYYWLEASGTQSKVGFAVAKVVRKVPLGTKTCSLPLVLVCSSSEFNGARCRGVPP